MGYIIYSETEFETDDGIIKKGEEINVIVDAEDEKELRRWLIEQYVLDGIDVSYRRSDGKVWGRITQEQVLGGR